MDNGEAGVRSQMRRGRQPPLGTAGTVALMLCLCAPAAGYAVLLLDRHGRAAGLADLSAAEWLLALGLLALPFAALRLLRIDWQRSADE